MRAVEKMYNDIFDSNIGVTDKRWLRGSTRAVQLMRTALSKAAKSMLPATEEMYPALLLHIDFSKEKAGQQLNGLSIFGGLRERPKESDYCLVDMVSPFVTDFLKRCLGMPGRCLLTNGHTLYSDLLLKVEIGFGKLSCTEFETRFLNSGLSHVRIIVVDSFADH